METIYYKNHEFVEISSTYELTSEQYDALKKYCEDYAYFDFNFELKDNKLKIITYDEDDIKYFNDKIEKYPELKDYLIL